MLPKFLVQAQMANGSNSARSSAYVHASVYVYARVYVSTEHMSTSVPMFPP